MDTNDLRTDEDVQCRICAEYISIKNGRMYIFDEDTKKNYLQTKIRKYLYILVSLEDRLPKVVCFTCIKRLESIHRFATMAHRAQERLKTQLLSRCEDENPKKKGDDNDKSHRGLLRSILIGKDEDVLDEPILLSPSNCFMPPIRAVNEDSGHTEQMEVKVDPMIFLQCGLDRCGSPDVSDMNSDEEKSQIKDISNRDYEETRKKSNKPTLNLKKSSSNINNLNNHCESWESPPVPKYYNCTICSHSFETQIGLQNHLWSHLPRANQYDDEDDDENDDDDVDDDDDDKPSLIISSNQRIYVNNSTIIPSLNCGIGLENSGDYGTNGSFICPICNKRISTKGNLKVHLETHRPKGKYGCDICGRIFKTQSNLFRHKEYHGGIQFPCSVCGRVYPTNSTLRAHSITHSDLRPHACPLCDKTFKRNQDLKFHINQHTGARPYQCPYCPKAFASSGNCFSHRKRMHPKEVHRDRQRAADLMR